MRIILANYSVGIWAVLGEFDAVLFMGTRSECELWCESECICLSY